MRTARTRLLLMALAATLVPPAVCAAQTREIRVERDPSVQLRLTEVLRIGSEDGPDALGRVMGAAFDRRGRIFVADDLNRRVTVFSATGQLVRHVGRQGQGPGEFQMPWLVAIDARDSLFVWDQAAARMSIFGPDFVFRRSFTLPPHWQLSGLSFLRDGALLVSAYGRGERAGMHVVERSGRVRRTFGPAFPQTDLAGYESSLLGGYMAVGAGTIAYSKFSPYEVTFHSESGAPRTTCRGESSWTTPVADVIERSEQGDAMRWSRFVHAAGITALADGLYLNVIHDPVRNRRVLDLLRADCVLVRRTILEAPVNFLDRSGDRLLAVRTLDYPEVVVYRAEVVDRGRTRPSPTPRP